MAIKHLTFICTKMYAKCPQDFHLKIPRFFSDHFYISTNHLSVCHSNSDEQVEMIGNCPMGFFHFKIPRFLTGNFKLPWFLKGNSKIPKFSSDSVVIFKFCDFSIFPDCGKTVHGHPGSGFWLFLTWQAWWKKVKIHPLVDHAASYKEYMYRILHFPLFTFPIISIPW